MAENTFSAVLPFAILLHLHVWNNFMVLKSVTNGSKKFTASETT